MSEYMIKPKTKRGEAELCKHQGIAGGKQSVAHKFVADYRYREPLACIGAKLRSAYPQSIAHTGKLRAFYLHGHHLPCAHDYTTASLICPQNEISPEAFASRDIQTFFNRGSISRASQKWR